MSTPTSRQFQGLVPILHVADFQAGLAYYTDKLGFKKLWDWGTPPFFGCIARDGLEFFLHRDGKPRTGAEVYLNVANVDAFYEELRARGAMVKGAPVDESWGMREFTAEDPDGNTFRIGQHRPAKDLKIDRVSVNVRLEKRLAAVLTDLARETNRSVGEVLEETLLHSFEPVPGQEGQAVASPHTHATLKRIAELKKAHGLDYDTHANYRFTEDAPG